MKTVFKVNEGRPNAVDLLKAGSIDLIIYTGTSGAHAFTDEKAIRKNAVTHHGGGEAVESLHNPQPREATRTPCNYG